MAFLADFHIHSTFSDGKHSVGELVDFYGSKGFGAIAITDHLCESETFLGKVASYFNCTLTHETFPLYVQTLKQEAARAWEQYRMVLIPGVEFTKNTLSNHRSAHVLALGLAEFLSADGDIMQLLRTIRSAGAVSIAAHPVWTRKMEKQTYYLWDRKEIFEYEFDAWEVASGPHFFKEVAESKLPKLATSDLHQKKQINSWKTSLNCERSQEAILDAIRKQALGFTLYRED